MCSSDLPECVWGKNEREKEITKVFEIVNDILKDAKVNYVSELIGKPVEVIVINDRFKEFRILTEVL